MRYACDVEGNPDGGLLRKAGAKNLGSSKRVIVYDPKLNYEGKRTRTERFSIWVPTWPTAAVLARWYGT